MFGHKSQRKTRKCGASRLSRKKGLGAGGLARKSEVVESNEGVQIEAVYAATVKGDRYARVLAEIADVDSL